MDEPTRPHPFRQAAIIVIGGPIALGLAALPLIACYLLVRFGGVPGWLALPLGGVLATASMLAVAFAVSVLRGMLRGQ